MHTLNLEKLELFCFKLGFALLLKENKHNKMVQDLSIPPPRPSKVKQHSLRPAAKLWAEEAGNGPPQRCLYGADLS